jgi:hypothetical protein
MILVSIYSEEETFVIRLKHKIDYVAEKKYVKTKSLNSRTIYVFGQLIFSIVKLIFKEVFVKSR